MVSHLRNADTPHRFLSVIFSLSQKEVEANYTKLLSISDKKLTHSDNVWMGELLQKFDFSKCSSVNAIGSFCLGANLDLRRDKTTTTSYSHYSGTTQLSVNRSYKIRLICFKFEYWILDTISDGWRRLMQPLKLVL